MSYTNHAYVSLKNESGIEIKSISFFHQYSDDPDQDTTWNNVAPNATTTNFRVDYNTGFIRTGQDYFWATVRLMDGSVWDSPGYLVNTLHDSNSGKTVTFKLKGSELIAPDGSSMKLTLRGGHEYNTWAAIKMKNGFPVSALAELNHKYSDETNYKKSWKIAPGGTSPDNDVFIVYYMTGIIRTGSDHWKLSVTLDITPYDNAPSEMAAPFTNSDTDKGCMLESSDNGKLFTFSMNGNEFKMDIASGSCTNDWKTWNGYNTLAFVKIKNDFAETISSLKLGHKYSDDTTWYQMRSLIAAGNTSSLMVVEYNTGSLRTGSDYWNIYVYLANGKWYQNKTADKGCMLHGEDAKNPLTFKVSTDKFSIDMPSGNCSDSMDDKGTWDLTAGRNPSLSYDKNAYIGSHNAYANFQEGFWYAQQSASLFNQIAQGATTLLLDIHYKDGDIYLLHEGISSLQPFARLIKLSEALGNIKSALMLLSSEPITIVFEDKVDTTHQSLIKEAFVNSGTWTMVFNADTYDVSSNGWPTLNELISMKQPLVVLTSNSNSEDFAYQWKYMSENVYGDASLDSTTWLKKRGESQDLNNLPLCALNHFPTWSVSDFKLTSWINRAKSDNATTLLKTMVDDCYTRYNRYPNWINADFWEYPAGGMVGAITYMNQKLQGLPITSPKIQDHRIILKEIDYSNNILSEWKNETLWLSNHKKDLFSELTKKNWDRHSDKLTQVSNLTMILTALQIQRKKSPIDTWLDTQLSMVVSYYFSIEEVMLKSLQKKQGAQMLKYCIPYLLLERYTNMQFKVSSYIRNLVHHNEISIHDQDTAFLAALAGSAKENEKLQITFNKRLSEYKNKKEFSVTDGYNLTHDILYNLFVGTDIESLQSANTLIQKWMMKTLPNNIDLGAELFTCYLLLGGKIDRRAKKAARYLKEQSNKVHSSCGKEWKCNCTQFKELVHIKFTSLMAMGLYLQHSKGEIK